MSENDLIKNKWILWLLFAVIAFVSFHPYFSVLFGNRDDVVNFMEAQIGNYSGDARYISRVAGRFYFYLVKPFHALPFLVDNLIYTKVFHFIPLLLCLILFTRILFELVKNKALSLLWLLLFFVMAQLSGYNNLLVTYPFYFTFSFALIMISFLLLLHYYSQHKKRYLFMSIIIFAAGLLFYETYLLYLIFFFAVIVLHNYIRNKSLVRTFHKSMVDGLPFILVSLLYIAAYFIYRSYNPSSYNGTSFAGATFNLGAFFRVIWDLSFTSFPLTVFEYTRDLFVGKSEHITGFLPILLDIFLKARVDWIIKGLLAAVIGYQLLYYMPKIGWKMVVTGILSGIILVAIPQILLALTAKYIYYVVHETMLGYLTTFYSLFGVLVIIAFILSFLVNLVTVRYFFKQIIIFFLAFGIFICSVLTDFSNYYYAKDIRSANDTFYALNELLNSDEFESIPNQSNFYIPTLHESSSFSARALPGKIFKWNQYIWAKKEKWHETNHDMTLFQNYHKKTHAPAYLLTKIQDAKSDEVLLILARLHTLGLTDSLETSYSNHITLAYFSPYKRFTVTFQTRENDASGKGVNLKIDEKDITIQPANRLGFVVNNVKRDQASTIFTLDAPEIDINSFMISNMTDPRMTTISINQYE